MTQHIGTTGLVRITCCVASYTRNTRPRGRILNNAHPTVHACVQVMAYYISLPPL